MWQRPGVSPQSTEESALCCTARGLRAEGLQSDGDHAPRVRGAGDTQKGSKGLGGGTGSSG